MAYTYQKTISTAFPNARVDADALYDEILALSLGSANIDYVYTDEDTDVCDIVFDVEPSSGDKTSVDGVVADHAGIPDPGGLRTGGGLTINALGQPSAPTVAAQGTTGSTNWGYKITAYSDTGDTLASVETLITDGNATLGSTDYNLISWDAIQGAVKYGIYRSTAAGTPNSTGLVGITTLDFFEDRGETASGAEPSEDTSGKMTSDGPVQLSVLGSGLVTSDASGNISEVSTLAALNSLITDATLDDSGSARDPASHASSHEDGGSDVIAHDDLSGSGTNSHSALDTHVGDDTKHRVINDSGTGSTELWSANKIDSQIQNVATGYNRRAAVIDYVDVTAAPPTEVSGDRYILDFTVGTVEAGWDGAAKGDIVEFNGATWDATTPSEGWIAYVDQDNKDILYTDDGTPAWEFRAVIVTDHGDLDGKGDDDHTQYHNDTRGDVRYYQKTEFLNTSAGAGDSGKPVVLDAAGNIDATMINDGDIDHVNIANKGTNTHAEIDTHIADDELHGEAFDAMKEPTGFPNLTDSELTFTVGTRTLEIDPTGASYDIWVQGSKVTISTNKSNTWTDVEGMHFFYLTSGGVLTHTTSFSRAIITENAFVTALYWDAANDEVIYSADERHGIQMDGATHYQLHVNTGTIYISGLNLENFTIDAAGDTNTHAQFSCENGTILDEDLVHSVTDGSPQDISPILTAPVLYLSGSGDWRKDSASVYSVKSFSGGSGRLAWNELDTGTWGQTEVADGGFVLAHIFATNDLTTPVFAVQGQAEYTTLGAAHDGATDEINDLVLTGMPFAEFVYIGAVIFQTDNTYTNTKKARTRTTSDGDDFLDFRNNGISPTGSGGSGVASHGDLAGVTSDQHHAQLHASTHHTGGDDVLAHDSITGSGTNTHTQIDTHLGDDTKHRLINDSGTGSTELWSANKIDSELTAITSGYSRRAAVIDYVDVTAAPPTEVSGDRYILDFTVGTVEAGWDGAAKGDIVEFNGTTWDATTPEEGWIAYVDQDNKDILYTDDGTPAWEFRDIAVTDHGDLSGKGDDDHTQYHNDTRGDTRYYQKTEFLNASTGASDSGKPVVLDADGNIDATMINDGDIDHVNIANKGTNTHAEIDTHLGSSSNPHSVTKTQVGLSNVTNDAQLKRADNDWSGFTTETAPDEDDIFLIEKDTSGAKRIVTVGNIVNGALEEYYEEDDGLSQTTSTTDQDKVVMTETLEGGDYKIEFYAELSANKNASHCHAKVLVDSTVVAEQYFHRDLSISFGNIGGFVAKTLTAASHTIKIVFSRVETGSAARIRRARLSVRRIRQN